MLCVIGIHVHLSLVTLCTERSILCCTISDMLRAIGYIILWWVGYNVYTYMYINTCFSQYTSLPLPWSLSLLSSLSVSLSQPLTHDRVRKRCSLSFHTLYTHNSHTHTYISNLSHLVIMTHLQPDLLKFCPVNTRICVGQKLDKRKTPPILGSHTSFRHALKHTSTIYPPIGTS